MYYDWKGALVTYIPGAVNSEPATYIPIGHNILCTYDYIFVNEFINNLGDIKQRKAFDILDEISKLKEEDKNKDE